VWDCSTFLLIADFLKDKDSQNLWLSKNLPKSDHSHPFLSISAFLYLIEDSLPLNLISYTVCVYFLSKKPKKIMDKKNELFDLSGKVVVITGGASGLGLGYAKGIAKYGGNLALWDISEKHLEFAKKELEIYGTKIYTQIVDVRSEEKIVSAYQDVIKYFGRIDCVFANAGLPPRSTSLLEMSTADYHALIDVSLHGAFYTLREGARQMVKRSEAGDPGGSLIFTGSLALFKGIPGIENYAAAKGAMAAVVRGMAVEFAKYGIRANTIAPGYIKTGMTGDQTELSEIDRHMIGNIPMGRAGYPEDFEAIAVYLCSKASSFHTGDTIVIDGADHIK
jgi:NAD(P)-dependent dehydrogenase (short-subunit alcohol dehydrogenase family)